MEFGHVRVSSFDQNPALQLDALQHAGCEKIFKDGISGATAKRPGLVRCLKALHYGDRLTVWKLDRLACNLRDLILMVEDLNKHGIEFRSLTEEINTTTPGGKLVFHIFAALAKFERGLIIERTREGLRAARARGVRSGPKPKLSRQQVEHAKRSIAEGQYRQSIADLFNVSRVTLYRAIAKASRAVVAVNFRRSGGNFCIATQAGLVFGGVVSSSTWGLPGNRSSESRPLYNTARLAKEGRV